MSTMTETSLTSMKAAFPAAPEPIQGIPTLASLIDLMLHICRCSQTQKTPASAKMNMLFCAASPGLYSFFTTEAYPATFFPFPAEVDAVPDFSTCNSDTCLKTHQSSPRESFQLPRPSLIQTKVSRQYCIVTRMPTPWNNNPLNEIPVLKETRILQRTYIVVSIFHENPLPHAPHSGSRGRRLILGAHTSWTASL